MNLFDTDIIDKFIPIIEIGAIEASKERIPHSTGLPVKDYLNELFSGSPARIYDVLYISMTTEEKIRWIDALCINQLDKNERTSQITIMSKIYKNCQQEIIWLGGKDENGEGGGSRNVKGPGIGRIALKTFWIRKNMEGIDFSKEPVLAALAIVYMLLNDQHFEDLKCFERDSSAKAEWEYVELSADFERAFDGFTLIPTLTYWNRIWVI